METGTSWMGEPAGNPAGNQGWGNPGGENEARTGQEVGVGGNEVLQTGLRTHFQKNMGSIATQTHMWSSSKTDCVTLSK